MYIVTVHETKRSLFLPSRDNNRARDDRPTSERIACTTQIIRIYISVAFSGSTLLIRLE